MKTRIFWLFIVFASTILITSCEHDSLIDDMDKMANPPGSKPCGDSIYFVNDIQPILRSNCAFKGCHGEGSTEDDVDLSTYAKIITTTELKPFDPSESKLFEVITDDDREDAMPPLPRNLLDSLQIEKIRLWILQGAQNNQCDGCDTSSVTYSVNILPIIQNNCKGCHSGSNPARGLYLTNYNEVKAIAETGDLYDAVSSGYMPYNQSNFSQCYIDQIKIWVDNGAMND